MTKRPKKFMVIGAGVNGLVAANYLARAGHQVTLLESKAKVGGACTSDLALVDGVEQEYPLGATTLGLMQGFVWDETGLANRLHGEGVGAPALAFFPGIQKPACFYQDVTRLSQELAEKWGEKGDLVAYYADLERVTDYLQSGYRKGQPPTVAEATAVLGADLTERWIIGSAKELLDHYLTADQTKLEIAQNVSESGPVSLFEPYSAFIIPIMNSGSVFGGDYGYIRGGIWQVSHELCRINRELGVEIFISSSVQEVDPNSGTVRFETPVGSKNLYADHIIFATDPKTAAKLTGDHSDADDDQQNAHRLLNHAHMLSEALHPVHEGAHEEGRQDERHAEAGGINGQLGDASHNCFFLSRLRQDRREDRADAGRPAEGEGEADDISACVSAG